MLALKSDRINLALCCWNKLDGFSEVEKNALHFKERSKAYKAKHSDSAKMLKKMRVDFAEKQAKIVRTAFDKWMKQREHDFKLYLKRELPRIIDKTPLDPRCTTPSTGKFKSRQTLMDT